MDIQKLKNYPQFDLQKTLPLINQINILKKGKNAVILAHNYMTPDIFYGVADFVGDSLALAREGAKTDADVIVMAGVHFMAETAKLMSPEKTVLMPNLEAGCSLADSITAEDVRKLKADNPGVPVVTYVNTTAAVKAECDITCTSGNAVEVVNSLGADKVLVIPDKYLASWIASQTDVEILTWDGRCQVHEEFQPEELTGYRDVYADIKIIAHPECPQNILELADFVGSTAKMINYVQDEQPKRVMLVTECSMSDNVALANPNVEFIRPCHLCPYMKMITLENIRSALMNMEPRVEIDPDVAEKAREAVELMLVV